MKILHFILPLLIFSFLACYAEENDVEINKRDDEEILASEDIGEISVDFIDQWERSNSSIDSLNDIAIGKSISKKKLGDYYQGGQLIEPDYVYRITNVETSENLYLFASRKDKSNDKWLVISTYAFPKGQTMAGFSYMLIKVSGHYREDIFVIVDDNNQVLEAIEFRSVSESFENIDSELIELVQEEG